MPSGFAFHERKSAGLQVTEFVIEEAALWAMGAAVEKPLLQFGKYLHARMACNAERAKEIIVQLERGLAKGERASINFADDSSRLLTSRIESPETKGILIASAPKGGYQYNMIENPGPLALLKGNPASNFAGGRYNTITLTEETVFYRAGEAGTPLGQWFSRSPISSVAEARVDFAVKAQWIDAKTGVLTGSSPIDTVFSLRIPKGTVIYEGPVSSQGGIYRGCPRSR
jgi:hypothetical protein